MLMGQRFNYCSNEKIDGTNSRRGILSFGQPHSALRHLQDTVSLATALFYANLSQILYTTSFNLKWGHALAAKGGSVAGGLRMQRPRH